MDIGSMIAIVPVVLAVAMVIMIIKRNVTGRSESVSKGVTAAVPAIVVLMVAALLIGSFASTVDDRGYELYDCVPLSSFGNGAAIDGDCAEIVTIGGAEYVRMKDLGTFTVTSGGQSKEYAIGPAHMDLILVAGQSNVVFFTGASYYEGPATVSPGDAFYLGHDGDPQSDQYGGQVREATLQGSTIWDMIADDGSMRIAGIYPEFCGGYVEETGHRLMTVSAAMGGRPISWWDEGGRAYNLATNALAMLKEQCEGRIILNPVGVLWWQGESDSGETEEYYLEAFLTLLDRFQDGTFGYAFPKVTSMLPRDHLVTIDNMIPSARAQLAAQSMNAGFKVASDLTYRADRQTDMRDDVHFQQHFYSWAGEAFAREIAIMTGHRPVTQTIVICEDPGTVQELPKRVTSFGTSGKAYGLTATWHPVGSGNYEASLSGAPYGTKILPGLKAHATLGS